MIKLKEKYQVLPDMPPEQFLALKADIAERGVLTPIDVDEEGHILDGHHRYRACVELGITDFPTVVRPGLSEEDRRVFARKSNMLRRHLNRKQVRQIIAEQLRDTPSWANNRIAGVLGVDSKTVQAVRRQLEGTSEIPKLDKLIGADGKERPIKQKRPPAIMASNADDLDRILKRIEEGASIDEINGFLSETGLQAITLKYHDPFDDFDGGQKKEWLVFHLFLGPESGDHLEWLLRQGWKTPAEWMGEGGEKYRRRIGMRPMHKKTTKNWEKFSEKHKDKSLSEIEALLSQTGAA